MRRNLFLAFFLVSMLTTMIGGCGVDAPIEGTSDVFVMFPGLDPDGDNWFRQGNETTRPEALCEDRGSGCELAMRSSALFGGGDCDNIPDDDPQHCRAVGVTIDCNDEYYGVCAQCINPGAIEWCDGVDNDCDCPGDTNNDGESCAPGDEGVDEDCPCLSDDDCVDTEHCLVGACSEVECIPANDCWSADVIDHECVTIRDPNCCVMDADCPETMACNLDINECVVVDCTPENECYTAAVVNHVCEQTWVDGCCMSDEDCAMTERCENTGPNHCEPVVCEQNNVCDDPYVDDHMCYHNRIDPPDCCLRDSECVGSDQGDFCVSNVCTDIPCDAVNVCETVEVVDHVCVHTPIEGCCLTSLDCELTESCNPEDNVCEPVVCEPDHECDNAVIDNHRCTHNWMEGCCLDPSDCPQTETCVEGPEHNVCELVVCDDHVCDTEEVIDHQCVFTPIEPCCEFDYECQEGDVADPENWFCIDNLCTWVDPCSDVTCNPGEICEDGACELVLCSPDTACAPTEGIDVNVDIGDCTEYRDEALQWIVPEPGFTVDDYGYGCLDGFCVVYNNFDHDCYPSSPEWWCNDNVDGDLDGQSDMLDDDCSNPPECFSDLDCTTGDNGACVDGTCEYCTPDCSGAECGDDGCGGSCGDCGTSEFCVSGICQSEPETDTLMVTYTVDATELPGDLPDLYLVAECKNSGGGVVTNWAWGVKDHESAPFSGTVTMTYQATALDLDFCKFNVTDGEPQPDDWWGARCETVLSCTSNGQMDANYNGTDYTDLPLGDNGVGGRDWQLDRSPSP